MLLSTRVFSIRNPYLFLKEGEDLSSISSFWHLAKLPPSTAVFSCWAENVVLQGETTEELIESFFSLFFSGSLVYYLEEQQRRLPSRISDLWHWANHSPSLTVQFRAETTLFLHR